jgi:hypothetical protein
MLHIQLIALGLAAVALAISGCGGSSKTGSTTASATVATGTASTATSTTATTTATTTTPTLPTVTKTTVKLATGRPLTRTALIAKGDAICARANKKLLAISIKNEDEFVRVLPQVAVYNSTESKELGKLVPPASLAHDWAQIINAAHLYSEYVKHIAAYAQETSYQAASPLVHTAEEVRKQMRTVAGHDGLKHCEEVA